jgi:deoxyribose-phosphate aldolase
VASVCINPTGIEIARNILRGSDVAVGTIIGFPNPAIPRAVKVYEVETYFRDGAREFDMVAHTGKIKSGDWKYVSDDIQAVLEKVEEYDAILKVIFENDFLDNDEQKIRLCGICNDLGVHFAKTSTGFGYVTKDAERGLKGYDGATKHDLELMRKHCAPEVQIKAAGKVRTLADALEAIRRGATRIGATATVAILDAAKEQGYE